MLRLSRALPTQPAFWERRGALAAALLPLGAAYACASRVREALAPAPLRVKAPVVCVGSALVGGTGKTPVALSLAAWLRTRHAALRVHFLTRGYGGARAGPARVQPGVDDSDAVGDEALLLAAAAPTWVARRRADGAAAALEARPTAQLLIMDDGLQHHSLHRDLGILVLDAGFLLGNGWPLPAGPLREPFSAALAKADALVALSHGTAVPPSDAALRAALALPPRLPLLRATARLEPGATAALHGKRVLPFAGTAHPERFFAALRAAGCEVTEPCALPDHAPLPPALLTRLRAAAERAGAVLATTEKDAARLPAAERDGVAVLPLELRWADDADDALEALLGPLVRRAQESEEAVSTA